MDEFLQGHTIKHITVFIWLLKFLPLIAILPGMLLHLGQKKGSICLTNCLFDKLFIMFSTGWTPYGWCVNYKTDTQTIKPANVPSCLGSKCPYTWSLGLIIYRSKWTSARIDRLVGSIEVICHKECLVCVGIV